jgi:hypothetical protein
MRFLEWLQSLPVSDWTATSDWGYPLLLSVHSIGMGLVIGLLFMLDLRVLGYGKGIPFSAFSRLMPLAWFGFGINAASGVLLFMAGATHIWVAWPFAVKMVCIAIGGVLSWRLWQVLEASQLGAATSAMTLLRPAAAGAAAAAVPAAGTFVMAPVITPAARVLASLSIVIWLAAIVTGRLIAYVVDHAMLHGH